MKVRTWFSPLLLSGCIATVQAASLEAYEKSLRDEAADTIMQAEKLQATEAEPPVTPLPVVEEQVFSASIIQSLEKALADKHDVSALKQEMGSLVAGALGQGMNLDEIRDAVRSAMGGMQVEENPEQEQTLESAHKVLDEVIEANRQLIEGPDKAAPALHHEVREAVTASAVETDEEKPAVPGVEKAEKMMGEQRHLVKKGETLSLIARQYYKDGLKYWKIYQANQELLSHPNIILVGQVLKIPE